MARPRIRGATDEWRAIARGPDVLYHVCTWPDKRGRWTEDDFYASGRSDWEDFRSHWRHYAPDLGGRCVEIGCGAGRVTAALAADFTEVVAVDVSDDMLARARAHSPDHVSFQRVDAPRLPVDDGSVEAVFTVHVLQHLDDADAVRAYVEEAHRALRPGGTLMAHIMLTDRPVPWSRRLRQARRLRRSRRALAGGREHSAVRMTLFTVGEASRLLTDVGFSDVQLRVFPVRSNGFHHSFWFGRR